MPAGVDDGRRVMFEQVHPEWFVPRPHQPKSDSSDIAGAFQAAGSGVVTCDARSSQTIAEALDCAALDASSLFMACFDNGGTRLLGVIGPRSLVLRGGLAFVLGVLLAGCSGGSASPPGGEAGGPGGNGTIGAAGSDGNGAGGIMAAGGAGGSSAGGQGGDSGTTSIGTCTGVAPPGIGVPAGTVVTVSNADDTDPATNAIDGDIVDEWSPGAVTGWITLTFPTPVMIGAVLLHADALPVSNEIFTLSTSTSTVPLASFIAQVVLAPGILLPEVRIPPGLYSDLTITVNAGSSWVGINEIWLLPAPTCP